ncbi:uncharacterized protein VTP21DRAFT_3947 [Calcarisporiella thermophila]|uniref:uncharacterized protein n=1 Tax=Calcarisporiella thermophila TaxID=911321 RepID=UPI003742FC02
MKEAALFAPLEDALLYSYKPEEKDIAIPVREILAKPAVALIIRRPGCWLCRIQAVALKRHREFLEKKLGIRCFAVVHEQLGAEEFNNGFWNGELYWDKSRAFYKSLGEGEIRVASLWNLFTLQTYASMFKALSSGISGNLLVGNGLIYGGAVVIQDKHFLFVHKEKGFGDLVKISEVLKACKQIAGSSANNEVMSELDQRIADELRKEGQNPPDALACKPPDRPSKL